MQRKLLDVPIFLTSSILQKNYLTLASERRKYIAAVIGLLQNILETSSKFSNVRRIYMASEIKDVTRKTGLINGNGIKKENRQFFSAESCSEWS